MPQAPVFRAQLGQFGSFPQRQDACPGRFFFTMKPAISIWPVLRSQVLSAPSKPVPGLASDRLRGSGVLCERGRMADREWPFWVKGSSFRGRGRAQGSVSRGEVAVVCGTLA
jgi:hypothetical protein